MAGHSKFKNIMHRKGAQDKKRAKVFSRLGREISVSVKTGGPDPESNIRLRSAISAAKSINMPKENIERAIKKGEGNDLDSNYEEVRYEGYGPEGIAIIVEAMSLYVIRREALLHRRSRIGENPYVLPIPLLESIDINTQEDFAFAETIMQGLQRSET